MQFKLLINFLFLIFSTKLFAQENYFDYHNLIIAAEDSIIQEKYESAFRIYKKAFLQYDFVFPRDPLIAAQFAYKCGEKDLAIYYLTKGFKMGLMPFHVLLCPIFNKDDSFFLKKAKEVYFLNRESYLKRVNADVIEKALEIRWKDQAYKNVSHSYTYSNNGTIVLDTILTQALDTIKNLTRIYGFPGQRVIGIVHNSILKEIGRSELGDLPNRYQNFNEKEFNKVPEGVANLNNFTFLSNEVILIALYHHLCAFQKLGREVLFKAVKSGHLHPNDYAMLYMAQFFRCFANYRTIDESKVPLICPSKELYNGGYGIVKFYDVSDSVRIDANRKKIGMCSMNHAKELYYYATKFGVIVQFGLMGLK